MPAQIRAFFQGVMVKNRSPFSTFRIFSLALISIALVLTVLQLVSFSRVRAFFPSGLKIAGVPVGGLDRSQAAARLLEVYSTPVALRYNGAEIQLQPSVIDFQLDVEAMLAAADLERTQKLFWEEFWDYLWGRSLPPAEIPLRSSYSEERLRTYLQEVAQRYDQPSVAALPIPGTVNFEPGKSGLTLNEDSAVVLVENALHSLVNRTLELPLERTDPIRPSLQNLEILLKQTLQVNGFEGIAGIYLQDLQTAQELHFATLNGENIPVQPDVAFTASSIIKIPIMISAFRRMGDNPDIETLDLVSKMIDLSGNEAADWLMERVIDPVRGPLVVSEDMEAIGLRNTFLAGKFTLGSPLLSTFDTPANSRTDINTDPDPYSQTTTSDIGMLLADLYHCSQSGGGTLPAVFPGEISEAKCQIMVNYLVNNKLPSLLTAGIPEGTQIAHKHGWVTTNGVIRTMGDAGIIYSPGGTYILVIFFYNSDQLIWDPASILMAELSRAVYNYYNLPQQ
jgi:beta-lactamase class A